MTFYNLKYILYLYNSFIPVIAKLNFAPVFSVLQKSFKYADLLLKNSFLIITNVETAFLLNMNNPKHLNDSVHSKQFKQDY